MHARIRPFLLILASSLPAPAVRAAEFTYDFVACGSQKFTLLEARPEMTAVGSEQWAIVARSATKEWENATQHCVGTWRSADGREAARGLCKWSDTSGNTAVGEFEQTAPGEGTWVWLGGTGKFKGIKGGGRWKIVGQGRPIVEGTGQLCSHDTGSYTLP